MAFLRGHAAATRSLSGRLLSEFGLTLNDYEVLLHLSRAPERRLRRVDLAERLLLTPSGITRLLGGLEEAGLVAKASCDSDARVTYAVLTDAGHEKLTGAAPALVADVEALFASRFGGEELETLAELLARLSESVDDDCEPGY